jgi:predicted  nucleic acid-binding Zn-ribbon protein
LRVFTGELLKEKESSIKREAELNEKVNGLEDKVQKLMIEIAEKSEEMIKRERTMNDQREEIKNIRIDNSNHQNSISDLKLDL